MPFNGQKDTGHLSPEDASIYGFPRLRKHPDLPRLVDTWLRLRCNPSQGFHRDVGGNVFLIRTSVSSAANNLRIYEMELCLAGTVLRFIVETVHPRRLLSLVRRPEVELIAHFPSVLIDEGAHELVAVGHSQKTLALLVEWLCANSDDRIERIILDVGAIGNLLRGRGYRLTFGPT